jgi:tetratricopeptide (TPR) repeat protein
MPKNLNGSDWPATRLSAAESALDLNDPRAAEWVAEVGDVAPPGRIAYLKGRVALQRNRPQEAVALLGEAVRGNTNQLKVMYWLADAEAQSGHVQAASDLLEAILKLSPHDELALRALVRLAQQGGDLDRAIAFETRLVDAESHLNASSLCGLGDLYLRKGDRVAGEQPLREGLQRDPYAYLCHRDLGELLRANGRLSEGESDLDFVATHFPEADPKTFASLALLYQAQGKGSQAKQTLAKGRRIFPENALLRKMFEGATRP